MSVLIKGMQKPDRCIDCPFMISRDNDDCILQSDEANELFMNWDDMKLNCPLIELPENHGNLVDVNEIRWDNHYDSDGNLSEYKIAYSDEMPDPVIKGEQSNNECIN